MCLDIQTDAILGDPVGPCTQEPPLILSCMFAYIWSS